jgi:hypothetical protein
MILTGGENVYSIEVEAERASRAGDAARRSQPVNIVGMSEHDSFEDRMRAIADQVSRSMQRMADVDLEALAEGYGIDPDRARTAARAAGQWLSDQLSNGEPLFGQGHSRSHDTAAQGQGADLEKQVAQGTDPGQRSANPGPHPLDLATGRQGLALSALDSGRWTVRPGSNQLAGTGEGPPPPEAPGAVDLVSDLRARDWITADGTLTLVGRHALARWCRTADDPGSVAPARDLPHTGPGEVSPY